MHHAPMNLSSFEKSEMYSTAFDMLLCTLYSSLALIILKNINTDEFQHAKASAGLVM